eukprot:UN33732
MGINNKPSSCTLHVFINIGFLISGAFIGSYFSEFSDYNAYTIYENKDLNKIWSPSDNIIKQSDNFHNDRHIVAGSSLSQLSDSIVENTGENLGETKSGDRRFLTGPKVLWELDNSGPIQRLKLGSNIKYFSCDVGFNRGRVTSDFLRQSDDMFVISVEANFGLYSWVNTNHWNVINNRDNMINKICPLINDPDQYNHKKYAHLYHEHTDTCAQELNKRLLLINAAAGAQNGVISLNNAEGDMKGDGGSVVFNHDENTVSQNVAMLKLEDVLKFVPTPDEGIIWDTYKIDVQGYESEVLFGS